MKVRALDSVHDWTFGKGLSNYLKDEKALEQNIATRVLSWLGDCFFAMQDGIDYRKLMDKGQQTNLEMSIKAQILRTEGVVKITEFTTSLNSARKLTVQATIDTIYGRDFSVTITQ
jgi:hypothetical protein